MKLVKFHPEAELEMIEAARFYKERQHHLWQRYIQSVKQAVDKTTLNHQIYKTIDSNIR